MQRAGLKAAVASFALMLSASVAHAGYVLTLQEEGSDVVASGSGVLDLTPIRRAASPRAHLNSRLKARPNIYASRSRDAHQKQSTAANWRPTISFLSEQHG
jgi:hypothetical protein